MRNKKSHAVPELPAPTGPATSQMPAPSSPNAATALTKPRAGGMPMRRVLVLNCGGTIGMQDTAHGYACGPPGFLSGICRSVPMIHDPAFDLAPHLDAVDAASRGDMLVTPVGEFGTRTLFRIVDYDPLLDSSNMTEKEWVRIASDIAAAYDAWDAFVVLHGTDTMAFTCAARCSRDAATRWSRGGAEVGRERERFLAIPNNSNTHTFCCCRGGAEVEPRWSQDAATRFFSERLRC